MASRGHCPNHPLTPVQFSIAEFPELAGLSDHDITVKIFNKCLRKQADKYKYRKLLEQSGYDKRISF